MGVGLDDHLEHLGGGGVDLVEQIFERDAGSAAVELLFVGGIAAIFGEFASCFFVVDGVEFIAGFGNSIEAE